MDQEPLFRPEAIEASRKRSGSPVRPAGLASWALTAFMLALVIAIGLFLSLAKFARVESISGSLEPVAGAARIVTPRSGVVTQVHVSEGQTVSLGDPLFSIGSDIALEGGDPLGEIIRGVSASQSAALQSQMEAMRTARERQTEESRARISGLRQRADRLEGDLVLANERLVLNQETLKGYDRLRMDGYVSEIRYRAQQAAVLDDRRAISSIESEIESTAAALSEAAAAQSRVQAEAQQSLAGLDSSRAALEERRATGATQSAFVITAPRPGRVTLQARQGSALSEGGVLGVVLPPGARLKAQLWAPSRAAGFIQVGDEVRLLYDAFPYQRFGAGQGKVIAVASAPTDPKDIPFAIETTEALYKVDVEISDQSVRAYGRDWALAVGSRATGDVVLESRSLLSWVLDPIRAIQARRMA